MTTWPKTKMEVLRDNTGCRHDVREIEGVYQCAWCSRLFTVIGEHIPRLQVEEPKPTGIDSGVALREKRVADGRSAAFSRAGIMSMAEYAQATKPPKVYSRDEMYEATSCCYNAGDATMLCEMVEQLLDDNDKLERIRQILPDLEAERATKGVARKLRGILGDG